jgi:hypothetical protein
MPFQPAVLQELCIKKLVNSIWSVSDLHVEELNAPKLILLNILVKGNLHLNIRSHFSPLHSLEFWDESELLYERVRFNKWFSREFISWLYFEVDMTRLLSLSVAHITLIKHIIVFNESRLNMKCCQKCLEIWLRCQPDTKRNNFKMYRKFKHFQCYNVDDTLSFMRYGVNWCCFCKQSPMFIICNEELCYNTFGCIMHNCPRINHDECLKCYDGYIEQFSWNVRIFI